MTNGHEVLNSAETISILADVLDTDSESVARILAYASPGERDAVQNLVEAIQLYFLVGARMHREVAAEVPEDIVMPLVNLSTFETEVLGVPQSGAQRSAQQNVPSTRTVH